MATIPTDVAPAGIDVDPLAGRIYVAISGADSVAVIDAALQRIVATVPIGKSPEALAVNPGTHRIYAIDSRDDDPGVSVIDGEPGSATESGVIARIEVPGRVLDFVSSFGVDPSSNRVYLPSFDPGGRLVVLDGANNALMAMVPVASNSLAAAFDPVASRVLVGHGSFFGRRRVTVVEPAGGAASDGFEVGLAQKVIRVDPVAHRIWVRKGDAMRGERIALVGFDGKTGRVLAQFARDSEGDVAVNPRTGRVYAVDHGGVRLSVFDGAVSSATEYQEVASAVVANGSKRVAVDPSTGRIYVSQQQANSVVVFDDLNTDSDPSNCGSCGKVCGSGQVCRSGQCVTPGSWQSIATSGAPPSAYALEMGGFGVWTGARLVVWGGDGFRVEQPRDTGGSYDPVTDSWAPITRVGAPGPRLGHSAVWTGREMVVWGGSPGETPGGRYDPEADVWSTMSAVGAPPSRRGHSAVWTGSRMIVWGGRLPNEAVVGSGASYDPVTDRWAPIALAGAPTARKGHVAVWTGSEMIVWGGSEGGNCPARSGGRYDPATDSWRPLSTEGSPGGWVDASAVWTGREMFVLGGTGCGANGAQSEAGRYDPALDRWRSVESEGAPSPRAQAGLVWTGREVLIWGGAGAEPSQSGARYDPATDAWSALTVRGAPSARRGMAACAWTGTQLLVWGGIGANLEVLSTGGVYTPP